MKVTRILRYGLVGFGLHVVDILARFQRRPRLAIYAPAIELGNELLPSSRLAGHAMVGGDRVAGDDRRLLATGRSGYRSLQAFESGLVCPCSTF
jgi:hypothetical protein